MRATDAAFVWWVPVSGHTWMDASYLNPTKHGGAQTRVRALVPNTDGWRQYYPLRDEPELFRRFTELEFPPDVGACEARVKHFADRYGALGVGFSVIMDPGEGVTNLTRVRAGADLATWYQAWWVMHWAVKVWDALQAGDTEALARWFPSTADEHGHESTFTPDPDGASTRVWVNPHVAYVDDGMTQATLHLGGWTDPTDYEGDYPSGPLQWAMAHLREWVNEQLRAHTAPRLQWDRASPDKAPMRLGVVPENLLGAMWWQLALAVEGALRYERCAACGQWFHIKPRGNRQNTRFCSAYCRLKYFRQEGPNRQKRKTAAR